MILFIPAFPDCQVLHIESHFAHGTISRRVDSPAHAGGLVQTRVLQEQEDIFYLGFEEFQGVVRTHEG
jgi:hypothetical protein